MHRKWICLPVQNSQLGFIKANLFALQLFLQLFLHLVFDFRLGFD